MHAQDALHLQEDEAADWSVWRQDDHGNVFEVCRQLTQAEARNLVAEFEARGHKQSYWAARRNT